jgi:hypothetical protein
VNFNACVNRAIKLIPSIAKAKKLAEFNKAKGYTIACVSCKEPLWFVSNLQQYGTRWAADIVSFENVPAYSEYWEKDQKTAKSTKCPKCGEHYLKAVVADGKTVAVPFVPEMEGL